MDMERRSHYCHSCRMNVFLGHNLTCSMCSFGFVEELATAEAELEIESISNARIPDLVRVQAYDPNTPEYRFREAINFFQDGLHFFRKLRHSLSDSVVNLRLESIPQTVIDQYPQCAICIEDFILGENVATLSCNHVFHGKCINEWFALNRICPICRRTERGDTSLLPRVDHRQTHAFRQQYRDSISPYGQRNFQDRSNLQSIIASTVPREMVNHLAPEFGLSYYERQARGIDLYMPYGNDVIEIDDSDDESEDNSRMVYEDVINVDTSEDEDSDDDSSDSSVDELPDDSEDVIFVSSTRDEHADGSVDEIPDDSGDVIFVSSSRGEHADGSVDEIPDDSDVIFVSSSRDEHADGSVDEHEDSNGDEHEDVSGEEFEVDSSGDEHENGSVVEHEDSNGDEQENGSVVEHEDSNGDEHENGSVVEHGDSNGDEQVVLVVLGDDNGNGFYEDTHDVFILKIEDDF